MISNPSLVYYACVARGSMILAEFNSKDADLAALAARCLEKTPPLHSVFSHTVRNRTYTLLIGDPFVFFAIYHEMLGSFDGLAFLNSLKDASSRIIGTDKSNSLENLNSHCFQADFSPVFHQLLASQVDLDVPQSPRAILKQESCGSLDSPRGKTIGMVPLLGRDVGKGLKKKKRTSFESNGESKDALTENKVEVSDDSIGLSREFSVSMQKNGVYAVDSGQQKAKKVWKKQVWVVLSLDLIVCSILFGVWLSICKGFKCIDS